CIGEVQRYCAPAAVDLLEKHHLPQHHWRRSSNSSGDSTAAGTGAGAAALVWVKAELENTPNSISSEKFEACVKELVEKERHMCKTHELKLRVLGFGPPTPCMGTRGSSDQNDNNDRNTTDEDDDDDKMAVETVAGAGSRHECQCVYSAYRVSVRRTGDRLKFTISKLPWSTQVDAVAESGYNSMKAVTWQVDSRLAESQQH
ncbi:hypothetical protein EDB85DRAFT_1888653, partial [Lactarius pseudohatsudake]